MFLVSLFGEPCLPDIQCSAITTGAICAIIEQNKNDIVVNKKKHNVVNGSRKQSLYL